MRQLYNRAANNSIDFALSLHAGVPQRLQQRSNAQNRGNGEEEPGKAEHPAAHRQAEHDQARMELGRLADDARGHHQAFHLLGRQGHQRAQQGGGRAAGDGKHQDGHHAKEGTEIGDEVEEHHEQAHHQPGGQADEQKPQGGQRPGDQGHRQLAPHVVPDFPADAQAQRRGALSPTTGQQALHGVEQGVLVAHHIKGQHGREQQVPGGGDGVAGADQEARGPLGALAQQLGDLGLQPLHGLFRDPQAAQGRLETLQQVCAGLQHRRKAVLQADQLPDEGRDAQVDQGGQHQGRQQKGKPRVQTLGKGQARGQGRQQVGEGGREQKEQQQAAHHLSEDHQQRQRGQAAQRPSEFFTQGPHASLRVFRRAQKLRTFVLGQQAHAGQLALSLAVELFGHATGRRVAADGGADRGQGEHGTHDHAKTESGWTLCEEHVETSPFEN